MKMTPRFLPGSIAAAALLLGVAGCFADTIILKNGTRYEGRILKDEGEFLLLEIQVTRTIRDERRVPKSEIEKIEKIDPAGAAFEQLADSADTPDLLDTDGYQSRIRKLKQFLIDHPTSSHNRTVRELVSKLEAEQKAVADGAIKLGGRMISPAEHAADAVTIDATILLTQMRRAADAGNQIDALRTYDLINKEFAGSRPQLDAVALVGKVLGTFRNRITTSLANLEQRTKEREVGLERMPAADRARARAIFEEQKKSFAAKRAEEKAAGIKWLSVDYFDKTSMEEALRQIDAESNRLERPDTSRLTAPDQAYREAWTELEGADEEKVRSIFDNLQRAKLPERYLKVLQQRAAAVGAKSAPPAG